MPATMPIVRTATLILFCLGLAGCGSGDGLAKVRGTVTLKGQPLEGASVDFQPTADGGFALIEDFWKDVKMRLYYRFRSSRVGIAVDMAALRRHYAEFEEGVAWADACGVNAIGTVIFLKAVPAHCLRARGRVWANGLAGTALEMEEMWRL